MRSSLLCGAASLATLSIGCKSRGFNPSDISGKKDDKKSEKVDPMAYNALVLWATGKGDPVFSIPQGYEGSSDGKQPDGFFYIDRKSFLREYSDDSMFEGEVTEGASYKDGVLEYPKKDGRELKLRIQFHKNVNKPQTEAIKHCENQKQRAVTAQELYDFCMLSEKDKSNNCRVDNIPHNIWSVSLVPGPRDMVWGYDGMQKELELVDRPRNYLALVCAGKP